MRRFLLLSLVILVLLPSGGFGLAHQLDHNDPDDVPGRMDIRRVEFFRGSGIMVTVRTYERFRNTDLQALNGHAVVDFDTQGEKRRDRYVRFGYYKELWCEVYANGGRFLGAGIATRDRKSLVCGFKRRLLGIERHIRWRVSTSSGGSQTFDEAPDGGGWFAH